MNNLHQMNLSTSSPYFSDSKIRYKLMNIYFWKDSDLWDNGNNTWSNGDAMYDFVIDTTINNKYNSVHIFIPGNYNFGTSSKPSYDNNGIASGFGDLRWNFVSNVYHSYLNNGDWWSPGHSLRHELGHNLNLYHSWEYEDYCDDTPPNNNCWGVDTDPPIDPNCDDPSEISNNMMDYNSTKKALTLDQVTRMHVFINDNPSHLYSGIEPENATFTLSNSGNNGAVDCCTINTGSSSATVDVDTDGSDLSWTKTGGNGSFTVLSGGETVNLSGLGSIYFNFEWEENCMAHDLSLVFYNGGGYRMFPNPGKHTFTISATDSKSAVKPDHNGDFSIKTNFINYVEVYDSQYNLIKVVQGNDQKEISFEMTLQKPGVYRAIVYEEDPVSSISFIKM